MTVMEWAYDWVYITIYTLQGIYLDVQKTASGKRRTDEICVA